MKIEEIACSAQVRELGKICLCVMNVVANSIDRVFRCFVAARCFPFRIPLHTLFIVVFFCFFFFLFFSYVVIIVSLSQPGFSRHNLSCLYIRICVYIIYVYMTCTYTHTSAHIHLCICVRHVMYSTEYQ